MTITTYVIGGTVRQAQDYCKKNDLSFPDTAIVHSHRSLRPVHSAQVKLVGTFHNRGDAKDILLDLRERAAVITDLTAEV